MNEDSSSSSTVFVATSFKIDIHVHARQVYHTNSG